MDLLHHRIAAEGEGLAQHLKTLRGEELADEGALLAVYGQEGAEARDIGNGEGACFVIVTGRHLRGEGGEALLDTRRLLLPCPSLGVGEERHETGCLPSVLHAGYG